MKNIPEKYLVVINAVLPLIVIIVLFVILGKLAFRKISDIQNQIATAKHDKQVLTEKLDLFKSMAVSGVQDSNEVSASLPDTNPSLSVVSQLKRLALENGLLFNSVKSQSDQQQQDSEIKTVRLSFELFGGDTEIKNFLLTLNSIAPITVLNGAKITRVESGYSGKIDITAFWADFPKTRPASIEEYQDLTEDERNILSTIRTLRQPQFVNLPSVVEGGKENPFSQ